MDSLAAEHVLPLLQQAFTHATPELLNSDQGSQFTCAPYVDLLQAHHITISMDDRGRALDNVFTERLWRSVKYEEVFLHDYEAPRAAQHGLARYFEFYNHVRPHQALGYRPPAELYFGQAVGTPVLCGTRPA